MTNTDRSTPVRVPSLPGADLELPLEVERLGELAYNLWWSWNPRARLLYSSIDAGAWARYRNPVQVLLNVPQAIWETLVQSDTFMESCSAVLGDFERYMRPSDATWFDRHHGSSAPAPIAYFSMEFGLHQSLAIYSGGLGVLSGDHCKSASDLGLPLVAVGLLYRHGYFRQTIDADGFQQHHYPEYDFQRLPLRPVRNRQGGELIVQVPFPERQVAAKVWLAQAGRVPVLLLDTDLVENEPADRAISNVLYVRGREMRLAQELVLGVGGGRALAELGIEPAVWHVNEGHSILLQLERLRDALTAGGDLEAAVARVSRDVAFTTHTPVAAGNEQFDHELARRVIGRWAEEQGMEAEAVLRLGSADHGEPGQPFNMTAMALRTSSFANGVSVRNAEVASDMWRHLELRDPDGERRGIVSITNGVHPPTWIGIDFRNLLGRVLPGDWLVEPTPEDAWAAIDGIPDRDIWDAHQAQKERLMRFIRARTVEQLARHGAAPDDLRAAGRLMDADYLTLGFARRFATYKRAGLIFHDLHRLRALLAHSERPVQIVLAGKAHPADRPGQDLIRHIFQLSRSPELRGRVVFLEDYDMRVGRMLVQGVDVWLNTPRKPLEACGTSGQKAAMNGVLNLSIGDGWWPEGFDGGNGWLIDSGASSQDEEDHQDREDALALYAKLEEEVVPAFYERGDDGVPSRWVSMMKRSVATIGPRFSSHRMVRDYLEQAYLPLVAPAVRIQ